MEIPEEEPIRHISDVVSRFGLLVFSREVGKDTVDGGTIALRRGSVTLSSTAA